MALPEGGGEVDVEIEVVAEKVHGVNCWWALGRISADAERIELSLPCRAWLSVCDRASWGCCGSGGGSQE